MTTKQIVAWGGGVSVGVVALIWSYNTFLTKEVHNSYVHTHREWGEQVLGELRSDIREIKEDNKDIKSDIKDIKRSLAESKRVASTFWVNPMQIGFTNNPLIRAIP